MDHDALEKQESEQQACWDSTGRPMTGPCEQKVKEKEKLELSKVVTEMLGHYRSRHGYIPAWAVPREELGKWWAGHPQAPEQPAEKNHLVPWGNPPAWAVDSSLEGDDGFFEPCPLTEGLLHESGGPRGAGGKDEGPPVDKKTGKKRTVWKRISGSFFMDDDQ